MHLGDVSLASTMVRTGANALQESMPSKVAMRLELVAFDTVTARSNKVVVGEWPAPYKLVMAAMRWYVEPTL